MTFAQNRVVELRKNVPSEKWNFCCTKLNSADLITRLEKNINSIWRKSNYSKIDDCEGKETFPETFIQDFEREIKNVVITSNKIEHLIPSKVDNIIKASNYSDINRLFRVTAFVVRFAIRWTKVSTPQIKRSEYLTSTRKVL